MILVEGVLRIIFKELDPMWLFGIWRRGRDHRQGMIDIIFTLYLLKCRI